MLRLKPAIKKSLCLIPKVEHKTLCTPGTACPCDELMRQIFKEQKKKLIPFKIEKNDLKTTKCD
tara:strand:- start:31 stop:222 length:192 start_codon:yes stop_codon:yes gene_type:complete